MKTIDCFMYFDEDMLLDLRLNILDQYVSKFVICEATYNHKGISKKLNFDIKKFKKFEKKIIYTVLDQNPPNLKKIDSNEKPNLKNSKILHNSITRDVFQRNHLMSKISDFVDDDLILISDLDEVPNLEQFRYKNKINIFCQKMFYYKLNLIYPNFVWHGTKACKKRHLNSPQWLRNIKSKKYGFWRLDTLFMAGGRCLWTRRRSATRQWRPAPRSSRSCSRCRLTATRKRPSDSSMSCAAASKRQ